MVAFGEALPKLRRKLKRDLGLPDLPREKVLAVVVSILDATRVRIGNSEYARDNKSFGLTTLRNRHVSFIRDGRAILNFRGKGGVQHEVHIGDKRIAQIMRRCQEIPGQHLFQYVSDDGQRCPHRLRPGQRLSAGCHGRRFYGQGLPDLGSDLAGDHIARRYGSARSASDHALKKEIADVVKRVATALRNTPAVCRKSYINPAVFDAWRSGLIHQTFNGSLSLAAPRKAETLVLAFLRNEGRILRIRLTRGSSLHRAGHDPCRPSQGRSPQTAPSIECVPKAPIREGGWSKDGQTRYYMDFSAPYSLKKCAGRLRGCPVSAFPGRTGA